MTTTATPEYAVRLTWLTETGTETRIYPCTDADHATDELAAAQYVQAGQGVSNDAEIVIRVDGTWTPEKPRETLISALHVEARASGPLVSTDDIQILDDMTPAELAEELTMHDQTARDNDSDRAYRAEIVTRLSAAA
ncbi:hypothetical protein [Streptosporangium roseum]|uniref:hypothetical protein n=1 Tax=Streptosporangium roseum TaxID=2001 RepID=UPI003333CC35